jgi:hypothetical protein
MLAVVIEPDEKDDRGSNDCSHSGGRAEVEHGASSAPPSLLRVRSRASDRIWGCLEMR